MGGWAHPDSPLPGDDASAGRGPLPGPASGGPSPLPVDDGDDGHFEWLVREIEAGRLLPPPESAVESPAVSISLGDACDVDPQLLAAACGPDGLGGEALSAAFGQDRAAGPGRRRAGPAPSPKLRRLKRPRPPLACAFAPSLAAVPGYLPFRVSGMSAPISSNASLCRAVGSASTGTSAVVPVNRSSLRVSVPRWSSSPW